MALLTLAVASLDSSNCPGCGGGAFDLAVGGRSGERRVGRRWATLALSTGDPSGYPRGAEGIVLALSVAGDGAPNIETSWE